jgi:hypothetical protein
MKRLRQEVERVVRPVVASEPRRNRMREELLGHLTSLYEQELARLHNEDQAAAAAVTRFGQPAELTRELQKSVPLVERIFWTRLPFGDWTRRRPGESIERHLWRVARWQIAFVSIFILLLTLLCISITWVRKPRVDEPLVGPLLAFMGSVVVVYAVALTVFPFACEFLRPQFACWQATRGRARALVGLKIWSTFLLLATVAAVGAGFVFAMLPENLAISASYPRAFWLTVAVAAILAVPLTAVQTWQQAQHARQFDDWDGTEPELSE